MKTYYIHITKSAERDIIRTLDYIEFVLKNSQAAGALLNEIDVKINELSSFPERFALINDSLLASWGIRFITINNYLAFYQIDELSDTVYIVRFLYQKSDWISILKNGFPPT